MTLNQVLKHFGTQADLARAIGCKRGTVNQWFARGSIPRAYQYEIAELTGGKLRPAMRRRTK